MYTVAVKRDFIAQHYLIGGIGGQRMSCILTTTRRKCNWKAPS